MNTGFCSCASLLSSSSASLLTGHHTIEIVPYRDRGSLFRNSRHLLSVVLVWNMMWIVFQVLLALFHTAPTMFLWAVIAVKAGLWFISLYVEMTTSVLAFLRISQIQTFSCWQRLATLIALLSAGGSLAIDIINRDPFSRTYTIFNMLWCGVRALAAILLLRVHRDKVSPAAVVLGGNNNKRKSSSNGVATTTAAGASADKRHTSSSSSSSVAVAVATTGETTTRPRLSSSRASSTTSTAAESSLAPPTSGDTAVSSLSLHHQAAAVQDSRSIRIITAEARGAAPTSTTSMNTMHHHSGGIVVLGDNSISPNNNNNSGGAAAASTSSESDSTTSTSSSSSSSRQYAGRRLWSAFMIVTYSLAVTASLLSLLESVHAGCFVLLTKATYFLALVPVLTYTVDRNNDRWNESMKAAVEAASRELFNQISAAALPSSSSTTGSGSTSTAADRGKDWTPLSRGLNTVRYSRIYDFIVDRSDLQPMNTTIGGGTSGTVRLYRYKHDRMVGQVCSFNHALGCAGTRDTDAFQA